MNKVELELDQALELFSAASIGKLINGLVHNLNGPLHTLGMEMDVLSFLFSKNPDLEPDFASNFSTRLKRMEEEFEKLNRLIRQTADRAELFSSPPPAFINLNHLLQEELEFLSANLYFKHRVQVSLDLDEKAKTVKPRTSYLSPALRWFLQGLVEDIERNQIQALHIMTRGEPNQLLACFTTREHSLSSDILELMTSEGKPEQGVMELGGKCSVEMLVAVSTIRSSGVSLSHDSSTDHSEIHLGFPYE
ncbi:MAG: hypothetical protein DRH15_01330 [Deltaproteobacteria bacterium]|nr:MAG: hypothetical protein DRH15_01330 [Deltaproteobacteria bacterium]